MGCIIIIARCTGMYFGIPDNGHQILIQPINYLSGLSNLRSVVPVNPGLR
jgi:hypothetical protein